MYWYNQRVVKWPVCFCIAQFLMIEFSMLIMFLDWWSKANPRPLVTSFQQTCAPTWQQIIWPIDFFIIIAFIDIWFISKYYIRQGLYLSNNILFKKPIKIILILVANSLSTLLRGHCRSKSLFKKSSTVNFMTLTYIFNVISMSARWFGYIYTRVSIWSDENAILIITSRK